MTVQPPSRRLIRLQAECAVRSAPALLLAAACAALALWSVLQTPSDESAPAPQADQALQQSAPAS